MEPAWQKRANSVTETEFRWTPKQVREKSQKEENLGRVRAAISIIPYSLLVLNTEGGFGQG